MAISPPMSWTLVGAGEGMRTPPPSPTGRSDPSVEVPKNGRGDRAAGPGRLISRDDFRPLLDGNVVVDVLDSLDGLGVFLGGGLLVAVVDEAAQLHDALEGGHRDVRGLDAAVMGQGGLDLDGDGIAIDVFARAFLGGCA